MTWKGEKTIVTDLAGKALLPGFIDAYGHLGQYALSLGVADLRPPPIANVGSIVQLQQTLTEFKTQHNISDTAWLGGNGYDDTLLEEKRHPTRDDLDKVSTTQPIATMHISGHLAVVNSKGLEVLHVDSKTPDPPGGVIQLAKGSREPNGVLEEHAAFAVLGAVSSGDPTEPKVLNLIHAAQQYASYGITNGQEDFAASNQTKFLKAAAQAGLLPIDVIVFAVWATADTELQGYNSTLQKGVSDERLREQEKPKRWKTFSHFGLEKRSTF
jgi:predicted amidohydrolase YtcJ